MLTEYQIKILKEANGGKMVKVDKDNLLHATILATNNFLTRRKGDRFMITPQGIHLCRVMELKAVAITQKIRDKITAVRFQTARTEYVLYGSFDTQIKPAAKPRASFGTVKGRVQAISSRGRLKFTLYDNLFDKSVTCYVQDDQEETMKDIWGEIVTVTGYVTRDSENGRAKTVRDITAIDPVRIVEPGSYKRTRGVLSWMDDEPAEVSIRRLRDDEG